MPNASDLQRELRGRVQLIQAVLCPLSHQPRGDDAVIRLTHLRLTRLLRESLIQAEVADRPSESGARPPREPCRAGSVRLSMQRNTVIGSAKLVGLGLLAGFVGTAAMSLSQKAEMRLSGRKPSNMPAEAVEAVVGRNVPDKQSEQQLSTAAHFAFGTSLGLGLTALSKVPEPARGVAFFAGAWGAGTGLITGLGVSDPPTKWDAKQLVTDLGHHAVYAASAALTFFGLRRLARL